MTTNTIKITIDGREVIVDGAWTILEAARRNGIEIPTLCHHPALSDWGGCRLCVVAVDHSPKLTASCVMPVRNGMEVVTNNAAILASRRMTLEMLFAERNHNCMFCPSSGACELQQMAYTLGMDHLTVSQSFPAFPVDGTGQYMSMDHNRCILCGRCVRACQEIAGCHVLGFHYRGSASLVGFDLMARREESACTNCGTCLQVCPTGAISSRLRTHYAVKGQPSAHRAVASTCAGCGWLCPTDTTVRDNQILRIDGLLKASNGRSNRGQLCHRGRFEVLKSHGSRLLAPMVRDDLGRWQTVDWGHGLNLIRTRMTALPPPERFGVTSSQLANEALVLFKELITNRWQGRSDTLDGAHWRNLTAAQAEAGLATVPDGDWQRIAESDMLLVIGADPHADHPLLLSLLRSAYLERAVPMAVIGRAEAVAWLGNAHLPADAAELTPLLETLAGLAAAVETGDTPTAGTQDPLHQELVELALAYSHAKNPLILAGPQLTGLPNSAGLQGLLRLAAQKESFTGENGWIALLTPAANSMTAWRLGLAADTAPAGNAGLLLLGEEPEPTVKALLERLGQKDFLAAITPYAHPSLTEAAQVLIPRPLWLEEDGSFRGHGCTAAVDKPRVLEPPPEMRPTWAILQALGNDHGSGDTIAEWTEVRANAGRIIASACA